MELLAVLNRRISPEMQKNRKWPKTPRGLGGRIRRIAPLLRKIGVELEFGGQMGERRRLVSIRQRGVLTVPTVPNSRPTQVAGLNLDDWDGRGASVRPLAGRTGNPSICDARRTEETIQTDKSDQ